MPTIKTEEYIEVIYEIVEKKGYARVKDVALMLDVGLSTVSEMFQKLSNEDYINYEKYSGVTLTEKGEKLAKLLERRHGTIKSFLKLLGLPEDLADKEACTLEHVMEKETIERLTCFVDFIDSIENPPWLERFKVYCATGELIECPNKDCSRCD
ncbi:MAG TPA: metal-dependent transcriptional regulator [Candidatus Methanofastidiosa archaeon]|nr:metal-dependent transcriptional regulator [Candidatus Methanofastidiosa archaeon]